MSENTPGPFFGGQDLKGRPAILKKNDVGVEVHWARPNLFCDRDYLVSLLNKGTHFEGMREALEAVIEWQDAPMSDNDPEMADHAQRLVRAALAAAAGENE